MLYYTVYNWYFKFYYILFNSEFKCQNTKYKTKLKYPLNIFLYLEIIFVCNLYNLNQLLKKFLFNLFKVS